MQSPAFIGMNANSTGAALDLCEIRDIHEEGISFQSPTPMEPGESFSLCLDLTEPSTYIHTSGRVVWSDPSGRTGLRFHRIPTQELERLREWLSGSAVEQFTFEEAPALRVVPPREAEKEVQALDPEEVMQVGAGVSAESETPTPAMNVPVAAEAAPATPVTITDIEPPQLQPVGDQPAATAEVDSFEETRSADVPTTAEKATAGDDVPGEISQAAASAAETAGEAEEIPEAAAPVSQAQAAEIGDSDSQEVEAPAAEEDASAIAAAEDVAREMENFSLDLEAALQIAAERTKTLTGATGTAIALLTGEEMVCRASAGDDAPPLGARLQVGSGFSGECVHSGRLLYCEDSETDALVDRESCRALGVRSIMAAPIHSPQAVVGLLEIFSPRAHAFTERDKVILQQMTQVIFAAAQRTVRNLVANPGDEPGAGASASKAAAGGTAGISPEPLPGDGGDDEIFSGDGVTMRSTLWRKPKLPVIAGTVVVLLLLTALVFFKPAGRNTAAAMQTQSEMAGAKSRFEAQTASSDDLRKMAQAGDADAQFQLGVRYAVGSDVPQDYTEAAHWFSAAAEQGHVVAQSSMGAYYLAGRGVEKDLNKAYFWALLAQAGGDEASRLRVPLLASRLSDREILADQSQAEEWFKAHQVHSKPSPAK